MRRAAGPVKRAAGAPPSARDASGGRCVRSLLELVEVHRDLAERFARHRDLVVGLEFGRALEALAEFETALRRHMEDEERLLLPLYESRVGRVPGGDPQFFYLEHANLLRNLETLSESLRRLAANPRAGRRQAHEFLHQEGLFLHLMEHHDRREQSFLYPQLDRVLTEEERRGLLEACAAPARALLDRPSRSP